MDVAPSLKLSPPTPIDASRHRPRPSPLSTSGSTTPDLTPETTDRERSSSETTIVSIYSMYGEEEGSWSPPSGSQNHRIQHSSKDLTTVAVASFPDYNRSFVQVNSAPLEDSGFYDATYDQMRPASKAMSMAATRTSVLSNDSTQLAYSDSRPPSSYVRQSTTTRHTSHSDNSRLSAATSAPSSSPSSSPQLRTSSQPSSRPNSRPPSRPPSRPVSQHRKSVSSHKDHSSHSTPYSSPRPPSQPPQSASPASLPFPQTPPLLQVPSPATPPRTARQKAISSPKSHHSAVSITPSEGEDPDAFHVRSTYAQLEAIGVKGDGVAEGVERTRARVGGSRASEIQAEQALADCDEKTRDLTPEEVRLLGSLDR